MTMIPPHLIIPSTHSWVEETRSLTERLKTITGQAEVEVIKHQLEAVDDFDCRKLKLSNNTMAIHREIVMRSGQSICWYARTIIPKKTFDTHESFFDQLNSKILGDLIYNNPDIQRDIEPYVISKPCPELDWVSDILPQILTQLPLQARLSTFFISSKTQKSAHKNMRFYLLEIFLPDLFTVIHKKQNESY